MAQTAQVDPVISRLRFLKRYGSNCLSYHTLQPGLNYFDSVEGYIAYGDYGGYRYALSDPVCSPEETPGLIEKFDANHRSITFLHISGYVATILEKAGYYINEMGEEGVIDLDTYTFAGRRKEDLRTMHHAATRAGLQVEEHYGEESYLEEADEISRLWLSKVKKNRKRLWFVTRSQTHHEEQGVRRFYGSVDGKLVAFIYFDPIWRDGVTTGYIASVLRRLPTAPKGALDLIVREAMERFRTEKVGSLSLGLLPLYNIEDETTGRFRFSPFVTRLFRWTHGAWFTNRFYRFASLSFHKERYRPEFRKIYMASRKKYPVFDLGFAARLIGVI